MKYRREKCRGCEGKGRVPTIVWVRPPPGIQPGPPANPDSSVCGTCGGSGRVRVRVPCKEITARALEGLLSELRLVREALQALTAEAADARKDRRVGWAQRHRSDCSGAPGCACLWGPK